MRNTSVLILIGSDILEPLREEACHVHVERGGPREDLSIARPAEPLVTLRAVSRNIEKVALLPPDDVVLQLIDQRARRLKLAAASHVGVDGDTGQALGSQIAGIAFNLHKAEALKSEVRLKDLGPAAL